ncbi:hypothetical protein D3C85_1578710 [compost metagenome]
MVFQFGHAQANRRVLGAMAGIAAQPRINAVIGLQLLARAGAGISKAVIEQSIEHFGVRLMPVALADHFAVPLKAVAFKCLENRRLSAGFFPWRVEVFHAHQPAATHRAGVEV